MSMFTQSDSGGKGRFLKLKNGETANLKFLEVVEKIGIPDEYSNEDGSYGEWRFVDIATDSEKIYTNKSMKNGINIAIKQAGVAPGEPFALTREGEGPATRYSARKLTSEEAIKAMNPAPLDEPPF